MSLRKSETLGRWTLLDTFCLHFWAWLLNTLAITPKSEDKKCPKVFNVPEFHFSEVTFFQNWYFNCKFRKQMHCAWLCRLKAAEDERLLLRYWSQNDILYLISKVNITNCYKFCGITCMTIYYHMSFKLKRLLGGFPVSGQNQSWLICRDFSNITCLDKL